MMLKVITFFLLITFRVVDANGSMACSNGIEEFSLMDTSVSPTIITDSTSVVDLADSSTCSFTIEASLSDTTSAGCEVASNKVQCVKFFLDGIAVHQTNSAPYIYSDDDDVVGNHTLKACTYTDDACTMNESGCKEEMVTFLDCNRESSEEMMLSAVTTRRRTTTRKCKKNKVSRFALVDTSKNPYAPIITPFKAPYIIDLNDYSTCALNIYAIATKGTCRHSKPIKCVKLTLGSQVREEVGKPYALYGNTGRFIRSGKPDLGSQTLTACTYTDKECTKGRSGCLSVDVYVKDCGDMSMPM